ncbi:MAG: threonylcarbamoyl-AMP synthase [Bacteroidia bacterium]|nr:threonylcarbamoyl-AMP synthase [Bacteroidia bacterium]
MENDIQQCLKILKSGGIILYPTDTVWGIGCDARNEAAVQRIFNLKQRADNKAMIVLLENENQLNKYVRQVPAIAWDLIEFTAQPLTIIYENAGSVAPALLAENNSLAIRICKEPFCNKLIHKLGRPLVSTSANISSQPTAASFNQIDSAIINGVDYVVSYRQNDTTVKQPSKIIALKNNGEIKIIR